MTVIKIIQAFFPVALEIVKGVKEAKKNSSEGGKKKTMLCLNVVRELVIF